MDSAASRCRRVVGGWEAGGDLVDGGAEGPVFVEHRRGRRYSAEEVEAGAYIHVFEPIETPAAKGLLDRARAAGWWLVLRGAAAAPYTAKHGWRVGPP